MGERESEREKGKKGEDWGVGEDENVVKSVEKLLIDFRLCGGVEKDFVLEILLVE